MRTLRTSPRELTPNPPADRDGMAASVCGWDPRPKGVTVASYAVCAPRRFPLGVRVSPVLYAGLSRRGAAMCRLRNEVQHLPSAAPYQVRTLQHHPEGRRLLFVCFERPGILGGRVRRRLAEQCTSRVLRRRTPECSEGAGRL